MNQLAFSVPSEADFKIILKEAKKFALDCDNIYPGQFIVARQGDEIAGFARIKTHDDCIELSTLGVLLPFRGCGTGRQLIRQLLKTTPAKKIYLVTVIPDYFRKSGFRVSNEIPVSLKTKKEDCKFHCQTEAVTVMLLERIN